MRKSIFILAILFASTCANAQIILEHTFEGWATISTNVYGDSYHYIQAPYYYVFKYPKNEPSVPEPSDGAPERLQKASGNSTVMLYNIDDFSLYKAIEIEGTTATGLCLVSRNILSTDNKVCFCLSDYNEEQSYIYNEDGNLVATLKGISPTIVEVEDRYMLILHGEQQNYTYIYSLPGNGEESTDISTPVAPRKSSTRKITRNGHVLLDTGANTYTIQGQQLQ